MAQLTEHVILRENNVSGGIKFDTESNKIGLDLSDSSPIKIDSDGSITHNLSAEFDTDGKVFTLHSGNDPVIADFSGLVNSGELDTAIDTLVDSLKVTDTTVSNQYVTSVSQTDGKINVTRKQITADEIPGTIDNTLADDIAFVNGKASENADSINKLNSDSNVDGSVANSIKTAIEDLNYVDDSEPKTGFVGDVKQTHGKIEVTRKDIEVDDLPSGIDAGKITGTISSGTLTDDISDLNTSIVDLDNKISDHEENTNNPHQVTKAQVGLANVDNTSDVDKPISAATQNALDAKLSRTEAVTGFTEWHFYNYDGRDSESGEEYEIVSVTYNGNNSWTGVLKNKQTGQIITQTDPDPEDATSLTLVSYLNSLVREKIHPTKVSELDNDSNYVSSVNGQSGPTVTLNATNILYGSDENVASVIDNIKASKISKDSLRDAINIAMQKPQENLDIDISTSDGIKSALKAILTAIGFTVQTEIE